MDSEFVFETKDEHRYAPSRMTSSGSEADVDLELAAEFAKIPDKLAFKIGEVAELLEIKPYVLRYWESEFEALKPDKSKHNQRMYRRRDVELVMMIKKLLYKDRFSIEGAKTALKKLKKSSKKTKVLSTITDHYENIQNQVFDLLMDIRQVRDHLNPES